MLTIVLPETENSLAAEIELEHSLVSLSKWESIHEKAFYASEEKTEEETISYINQMLLTKNPPADFIDRLTAEHYVEISKYINAKRSATWFREEENKKPNREIVTSELIYYWMLTYQIPFTCETWHLNRLMTLIRICAIKQSKPKKMSKQALAEQYRDLNARRRSQLGTSG